MNKTTLIRDLVIKYLGEPIKVVRAETSDRSELIFYAKSSESSALVPFADFCDCILPDATNEDLSTLVRAYVRSVQFSVDAALVRALLQSLRAFLVWVHRNSYTPTDLSFLIQTKYKATVLPLRPNDGGSHDQ